MLSHLFSNWKQIFSDLNYDIYSDECIPCYQEVFIVEKWKKYILAVKMSQLQ